MAKVAAAKTVPTTGSVPAFLDAIADPAQREDCRALAALMQKATGKEPTMWGPSIVGFGSYHYKYASGREGDAPLVGFSPRKGNISVYVMPGFEGYDGLMKKLGKYKAGKACIYIKKLEDIDVKVLQELVEKSADYLKNKAWP